MEVAATVPRTSALKLAHCALPARPFALAVSTKTLGLGGSDTRSSVTPGDHFVGDAQAVRVRGSTSSGAGAARSGT